MTAALPATEHVTNDPLDPALAELARVRLAPVVSLASAEQAVPLADALVAGGLPVAEVTFRTSAATESLRIIADRGDLLPIAGTVRTVEHAERAIDSGAQLIVTPGCNPTVMEWVLKRGVALCPGVCTPTDIETAASFGLTTLKFFPAEAAGGASMVRALAGPYPELRFMPTGGVTPENLQRYLEIPNVVACGGSWMVNPSLYQSGDFSAVVTAVKQAVLLAADGRSDTQTEGVG